MLISEELPFADADVGLKKGFEFEGKQFSFRLRRNDQENFYTIEVFDENNNFVYSSRISYKFYFRDAIFPDLPFQFIPIDVTEFYNAQNATKEITSETLGNQVKLYTSLEAS